MRARDQKNGTFDPVHGLRTPNEGINQRYLKNWADVADKIPPVPEKLQLEVGTPLG